MYSAMRDDSVKLPVVRSTFMEAEEIDREREQSGWNPYVGEEELPVADEASGPDKMPKRDETADQTPVAGEVAGLGKAPERDAASGLGKTPAADEVAELCDIQPYFMTPDYAQVMEEQQEAERDLRKMQSMYSEAVKLLLPYVEEECDKLEYEGSPMFDEYPDRSAVYRMEEHIFGQVKDQFPEEEAQEPEEVLSMQYRDSRVDTLGRSWGRDLARVLLLNEMYHRRCRYRGCKRRQF